MESSSRHLTPLFQDQAAAEAGGGAPGAALAEAQGGAGEPGGSPAGELAPGGRVSRDRPSCAQSCAWRPAPPPRVGAAPAV